jgi:hypothetical protein
MLLKILYFLLIVVVFRVALRMVRMLFSSPRENQRVHPRNRKEESLTSGKRVIDVDYTEPKQTHHEEEAR